MLIIFDLDDTLINTTGSITPILQRRVLEQLVHAGLEFADFDQAYAMLRSIDKGALSSRSALREFLEIYDGLHLYDIAEETIYRPKAIDWEVDTLDYALTLLPLLAKDHTLSLVTAGEERVQREKLSRSKINEALFDSIHCCPDQNKGPIYKNLLSTFTLPPRDLVVIGDRISTDLAPAKALGINTVHMRFGRGLGNTGLKSDVDYTILRLEEVPGIVRRMENSI